jgi:AMMECR1 domain-containing protein
LRRSSIIDELAERADGLESNEDDRDRRGAFVDDEDYATARTALRRCIAIFTLPRRT